MYSEELWNEEFLFKTAYQKWKKLRNPFGEGRDLDLFFEGRAILLFSSCCIFCVEFFSIYILFYIIFDGVFSIRDLVCLFSSSYFERLIDLLYAEFVIQELYWLVNAHSQNTNIHILKNKIKFYL